MIYVKKSMPLLLRPTMHNSDNRIFNIPDYMYPLAVAIGLLIHLAILMYRRYRGDTPAIYPLEHQSGYDAFLCSLDSRIEDHEHRAEESTFDNYSKDAKQLSAVLSQLQQDQPILLVPPPPPDPPNPQCNDEIGHKGINNDRPVSWINQPPPPPDPPNPNFSKLEYL
ncbi:unnamed protein product [Mytilus coruscus]|uniref:Uncharacterized protein n=1 Tax=Mytilus coruscus TaxID=42192 RepID=A0A6J8BHU1_MYTCO|nr:unnamed protein product [Mytilus coruscus]